MYVAWLKEGAHCYYEERGVCTLGAFGGVLNPPTTLLSFNTLGLVGSLSLSLSLSISFKHPTKKI